MARMQNILYGINNKIDNAGKTISKLEDIIKSIPNETQKEKRLKKRTEY